MKRKPLTTRDDFELWLFYMPDHLERFLDQFPKSVRKKLDYSPQSLDVLEQWILDTYASSETMLGHFGKINKYNQIDSEVALRRFEPFKHPYYFLEIALEASESQQVDGCARYIGQTFRKAVGGKWTIDLKNEENAFFGLPIIVEMKGFRSTMCPHTLSTAAANRRRGDYLSSILEGAINRATVNANNCN